MTLPKVMFVCLGNVNRSAAAEGILKHLAQEAEIELTVASSGTGGHFAGYGCTKEMLLAAEKRGIDLSFHIASQLTKEDLQAFDLIVCMDAENYQDVKNLCGTPRQCQKLRILLRDYLPAKNLVSVPDPYYVGGHEAVLDLIDQAVQNLFHQIVNTKC